MPRLPSVTGSNGHLFEPGLGDVITHGVCSSAITRLARTDDNDRFVTGATNRLPASQRQTGGGERRFNLLPPCVAFAFEPMEENQACSTARGRK